MSEFQFGVIVDGFAHDDDELLEVQADRLIELGSDGIAICDEPEHQYAIHGWVGFTLEAETPALAIHDALDVIKQVEGLKVRKVDWPADTTVVAQPRT